MPALVALRVRLALALHRLSHLFSLNRCEVVDGVDVRGYWVGGRCVTCGRVHPATKWYPRRSWLKEP